MSTAGYGKRTTSRVMRCEKMSEGEYRTREANDEDDGEKATKLYSGWKMYR